MNAILFIVLRKMRAPLLVLSTVYATATLGMALIPGVDDQGNAWRMDFFHAFYFVSFMGTTIGFGEIPYPFTEAQRLWSLFFIYLSVIAWIYAMGTVLALLRNETLRRAFTERRFARAVQRLREPFYVVCGYGDTGSALVDALERRWLVSTVIEIKQERINALILRNHPIYVPKLCADAGHPETLLLAGVCHPRCAGVVALTDQNKVNLHIAISAKVLNPSVKVICRAESHEVEANMASFGTDQIIDPFDTFADHLATALYAPCQYLLDAWLGGEKDDPLREPLYPPRGPWVLCGYGRFGKAVYQRLREHGMPVTVIEPDHRLRRPPDGSVSGWGTEAVTLREANVEAAVGIVAGTNDDSNNLSIIMTAKELNPALFVVARQNQHRNEAIFDASGADILMEASRVLAHKIRALLTVPLLDEFLRLALENDDQWACRLISRLAGVCDDQVPEVWEVGIEPEHAYAVTTALARGESIRLGHLLCDPRERADRLPCIALLLVDGQEKWLLPDDGRPLKSGTRVLFAGSRASPSRMAWTLQNDVALTYVTTGEALPQSHVWRWINRVFARNRPVGD